MHRFRIPVVPAVLSLVLLAAFRLAAQQGGASQGTQQYGQGGGQGGFRGGGFFFLGNLSGTEFSVERLVTMVGYFLPPPSLADGQGGPRTEGQGSGGQRTGTQGAGGQGTGPAGGFFQMPQVDPRFYLTAAQIDKLLPFLNDLHDNPYPSPSKAKRIQAGVDETITQEQRREWDSFVKTVEAEMKRLQSQFQSQAQGAGQAGTFQNLTPEQRQAARDSFGGNQAAGGGQARRELTPEQIRQRLVDGVIQRMVERRKTL